MNGAGGFTTHVEIEDAFGDCEIYDTRKKSAKQTCLITAARLRELAYKFELLAEEKHPCLETSQNRINGIKLTDQEKQEYIFRKIQNET